MLGIDNPPLATTSELAVIAPSVVRRAKPSSSRCTASTLQPVSMRTPAAAHSSSSMRTICFEDSSQNSWPSSFSW